METYVNSTRRNPSLLHLFPVRSKHILSIPATTKLQQKAGLFGHFQNLEVLTFVASSKLDTGFTSASSAVHGWRKSIENCRQVNFSLYLEFFITNNPITFTDFRVSLKRLDNYSQKKTNISTTHVSTSQRLPFAKAPGFTLPATMCKISLGSKTTGMRCAGSTSSSSPSSSSSFFPSSPTDRFKLTASRQNSVYKSFLDRGNELRLDFPAHFRRNRF